MKKWILLITSALILGACGETESTDNIDQNKEEVNESSNSNTSSTEKQDNIHNTVPLTLDDFNNKYELDTEYSEPFINGEFELKDGTIVHADWYFYLEGETFYYASSKFIDAQLVQAQLELKDGVTKEDVLKELGLSDEVTYNLNENTNVVNIVIDERFDKKNIKRLPNEWD